MKPKHTNRKLLLITIPLLICWTLYIFNNSMQPSEDSNRQSSNALEAIENVVGQIDIEQGAKQTLIRKGAHVFEFAVLGILLYFSAEQLSARPKDGLIIALLAGLLIASADETIQLLIPGREGKITDVFIDFAGVSAGTLASLAAGFLWRRRAKPPRDCHKAC